MYIYISYTCVIMRGMLVSEWWHVGSIVFQLVFHAISSLWNPNWWNPKWMDSIPSAVITRTPLWGSLYLQMVKLDRLGHGLRHWPSVYQLYPTMQFLHTHLAHTCSILYHNHCVEAHGIHFMAYARHLFDKGTFSIHLLIQSKPFNQAMSRSFHIPWW